MMSTTMNPIFGGSGITEDVFQAICGLLDKGDTVLELGGGAASTPALASRFTVYTVEHDPKYLYLYPSTYIHAPLVNGWYSREVLEKQIPKHYDLVLVDGPPGDGDNRSIILENFDLFNFHVPYVVHDVHRPEERQLAQRLADRVARSVRWGDEFAVI